ncbi:MAG: EpsI family protein [Erythrobacter sp.]|nr:EpsI family protein [Erythrobacter sp.]
MIDRRRFVLASLLSGAGVAAFAVKPGWSGPAAYSPDLDALMPEKLGQWTAGPADAVILANPDDLGESSYDALAVRHYGSATSPGVTVLIAYGQAQSYATQLHRPEFCYPASGFRIGAEGKAMLPFEGGAIPAQTLTARRGDRTDELLYWARIGGRFPQGIWDQRFAIARGAIASQPRDGILVRLSATNPSEGTGEKALEEFALRFVDAQDEADRALLIGPRRANPAADRARHDNTPPTQSG